MATGHEPTDPETSIREAWERGDFESAATRLMQYYGPEVQELRQRLPAEDQQILILRVSRQLSWTEIAMVLGDEGLTATEGELQRETTRLRKRFQLAKDRLRELARQEGLTE